MTKPTPPAVPVADRPRLLLVEDDPQLSDMLIDLLGEAGHTVEHAADGQAGLHLGLSRNYQVIVLDRRLPAIEGVDLLRRLRSRGVTTPALVLTARASVADRVEGLDAGAEDYLTKPFDVDELLARVRALLRRHTDRSPVLSLGRQTLDVTTRQVREPGAGGAVVTLSGRECALLQVLASRPARAFTREELLSRVFDEAESLGAVDTYVHYLRRKLGHGVIRTVRGIGYQLGSA
ncbi:response regulator transcription factor [Dactylosporangium darangshiense]|uniref:response regulator transcription factor n=1 Tax=Dactylosporangium darangshiense TaxID=579108 RepID=UPI0031E9AE59